MTPFPISTSWSGDSACRAQQCKLASPICGEAVYSSRKRQQERVNALSKGQRRSFFELHTAAVADLNHSDVDSIHVPIDE